MSAPAEDRLNAVNQGKWFGWLSFLIVAGYFMVGFWPFEFRPQNHVRWLTTRDGLSFEPYGIAYDPSSLPAANSGRPANFTVELWVAAQYEPADNIFDILTIYSPQLPCDFTLCQWKQDFLLRATTQPRQRTGRVPELDLDNALPEGKPQFITIRGDGAGTDCFLNGKAAGHFSHFVVNAKALDGQLILGNSASGKQSWTGNLLGLAVYDQALGAAAIARHYALWTQGQAGQLTNAPGLRALYQFAAGHGRRVEDFSRNHHHLYIPPIFEPVRRALLIPPWKDLSYRHPDYSDIVINILGFMPFGFCFYLYRRPRRPKQPVVNLLLVVLTGLAVSLTIEIVQAWLPNRTSSVMDLLTNTTGTLLGVILALVIGPRLRAPGL